MPSGAFSRLKRARVQAANLAQEKVYGELVSHKAVLEQAFNAEEIKLAQIKSRYAESLRNGYYDDAVEAQNEMIRTNSLMQKYAEAHQELETRTQQRPQPQQDVQRQPTPDEVFEYHVRQVPQNVQEWGA